VLTTAFCEDVFFRVLWIGMLRERASGMHVLDNAFAYVVVPLFYAEVKSTL
jgi:hypothetical protein